MLAGTWLVGAWLGAAGEAALPAALAVPPAKALAFTLAGRFARLTSLQRVDPAGGAAPTSGCDARREGEKRRVPYRAIYRFFVAAP